MREYLFYILNAFRIFQQFLFASKKILRFLKQFAQEAKEKKYNNDVN